MNVLNLNDSNYNSAADNNDTDKSNANNPVEAGMLKKAEKKAKQMEENKKKYSKSNKKLIQAELKNLENFIQHFQALKKIITENNVNNINEAYSDNEKRDHFDLSLYKKESVNSLNNFVILDNDEETEKIERTIDLNFYNFKNLIIKQKEIFENYNQEYKSNFNEY